MTNEYVKDIIKKFRQVDFVLFFWHFIDIKENFKEDFNVTDIHDIIKKLNLDKKYIILLNENNEKFLRDMSV